MFTSKNRRFGKYRGGWSLFSCWGNGVLLVVGRTLFCVSR